MLRFLLLLSAFLPIVTAGTLRAPIMEENIANNNGDDFATFEVFQGDKLIYYKDNKNGTIQSILQNGESPIIAIGEKAWELVKNNKAVVDYSQDWAGAVPQEYEDDWTSLYGWENVKSEEFRFHYKVGGDTVSELKWKYSWDAMGKSADGKGAYVMNGGCLIEKLYARTGQTLTSDVVALSPLNYGTPEDPIGGINIQLSFTSASAFNSATTTCMVTIRGDKNYNIIECQGNDP